MLPTHLHHRLHSRQSRLLVSGVNGSITRRVWGSSLGGFGVRAGGVTVLLQLEKLVPSSLGMDLWL